jgi:conjugal transfer pilus assembly protein TraF
MSCAATCFAVDDYYERGKEGWFWYEVIPEEIEALKRPEPKPQASSGQPSSALAELESIQKRMEEAEARAVLYPTQENVQNYMQMNKWRLERSAMFSDVWRRVVWTDPSLDYSTQRPNNNSALQVYHSEKEDLYKQTIAALSEDYGIWFFFRGSCPYCHRFAPILADFSRRYGIDILPITLDGGTLPEFPNPKFDLRVAEELNVTVVPSVFLVNPKTRDIIALSHGLLSQTELAQRIYVLTQTKPGEEY